ncbi:uncharacterized protein LOC120185288 [Hibiscus syriacus]|uniref:uncharacterized protein LOC120185288 n=1 Tax=Hibiscus syriacus TaxID=106335 RepID=UPI0019217AC7|nr:uncharacterized protein LOC120185288 [Hibiscus syriacus]
MAYIPPHKRQSKDSDRSTPTPECLIPRFNSDVHLRASRSNADRGGKILYLNYAISRWFVVGLDDGNSDTFAAHLKPVSIKVGENVLLDLLSSFEKVRAEIECGDVKLSMEDEMQSIRNLIDSTVIDPDVKGGLRWPFGKVSSGNIYNVVGVCHTMDSAYENSSIRLKVQHADRFDFKAAYGEASEEAFMKLKGSVSGLMEKDVGTNVIFDMLRNNLGTILQHFLAASLF